MVRQRWYYHSAIIIGCAVVITLVNIIQNTSFLRYLFGRRLDDASPQRNRETDANLVKMNLSQKSNSTSLSNPSCERKQIFPGKWLPIVLDKPPYVSKTIHLRCQGFDYDYDHPGLWNSWYWAPDDTSCVLRAWNATLFCDMLPFSSISIIGDSLSWEQFSSLLQLLGQRVHQNDQHASRLEERDVVYSACKDSSRVTRFVFRNDAQLKARIVQESISEHFPTILILNRGAHYVDDDELLADMTELLPVLLNWQKSCATVYNMKCHLFWRTTVPGHTSCEQYTSPVNDIKAMETLVETHENYLNETIWNFHWQDYKHQNQLVLDYIQKFSDTTGLQYEVLDAYELNVLRPDGHRWHQQDCLHNCYPGKMDVYNQLLLHFLTMQRSIEDSQQLIERFDRFRQTETQAPRAT